LDDEIKDNEIDGVCGTHGRGGKVIECCDRKPEGKRVLGG
jgi:hypothetical protein